VPQPSEVARVLGPRAVQIRDESGKPKGAAISSLPIAVPGTAKEPWQLVDLAWKPTGERLTVSRSAIPVSLPTAGSGPIRVGDLGARLAPEAASSVTANVSDESVIYPNVAPDTDLAVRSLSVGAQVGWVLRSPAASETIRVPLELPAGVSSRLDRKGGIELIDAGGRRVGSWSAATAVDAGGFPLALETSLDGSTVTIRVDHRADETEYPVVVDPYFQAGGSASTSDFNAWEFSKTRSNLSFHTNDPGVPGGRTSLFLGSGNVGGWAPTDFATLGRPAPGDQTIGTPGPSGRRVSPEHAYWSFGSVQAIKTRNRQQTGMPPARPAVAIGFSPQLSPPTADTTMSFGPNDLYLHFGPWHLDYATFQEVSANIFAYSAPGAANSGAWAVVSMLPGGSNVPDAYEPIYPPADPNDLSTLSLTSYSLNAVDDVAPTLNVSPSAGWLDDGDVVRVTGTDRGLGISSITANSSSGILPPLPAAEDSSPPSCPATGDVFCTFVANVDFSAADLAEGKHQYTFGATDGGGKTTSRTQQVSVDRSGPEVALAGALYVDRATEIVPTNPPRQLTVSATDGNPTGGPTAQRSGVQRIEVYVDDELVHEAEQTVSADSTPLSTTWTPDADTFTSGEYTVEVVATDRLGHESRETFTAHAPCCGAPLEDDTVDVANRVHAVGDVDGDGQADIVLVTQSNGNISVRLGQGDGTFGAASSWGSFGTAIDQIAVGEVDGESPDGPAETLTPPAGDDIVARLANGALVTLLSDGETFAAESITGMTDLQTTWPLGWSLGLADVDGDGADDVWGVDDASGELHIGYSYGPAFAETDQWSVIPATRDVQFADLDGDGLADLVTYEPSDGVVRFHQSTGDGFAPTDTWGQGPEDADLQTADVNGDGLDDAIFRDTSASAPDPAPVTARISSSNEGFVNGTRELGTLSDTYTLYAADLTGEGREDVLGLRIQGTQLLVHSIGSNVPVTDELDLTEDDPDQDSDEIAARGTGSERKAALFMSDDNALRYGIGLNDPSASGRNALLDKMKSLGATGVRTIAYWGKIDRLRPTDDATLVPAPGQPSAKPDGAAGGAQSETNPPTSPRTFVLARDVGVVPESLAGTVDDPAAEWIGDEWRIVKNRFYTAEIDQMLGLLTGKNLDAHVTITGSNRDYFDCKEAEDQGRRPFGVRGCDMPNPSDGTAAMTGLDPDPKRAGHALASIAQHLQAAHPTTVKSIGVWNEPNLPSGAFLSRPNAKGEQNTTVLYGRIYAYTWENLRRRSLLSGPNKIRVGFGEVSSAPSTYRAHSKNSGLRVLRPDQYVKRSLDAAKAAPGVAWPTGGYVRADFLAVHPYQHTSGPWARSTRYPWGVRHVGAPLKYDKGRKTPLPSVKGFLAAHKSALFRQQGSATAPEIWATEFGYFNVKGRKKTTKKNKLVTVNYKSDNLKQAHGERERARFMTNNGGTRHGALRSLSNSGNVKMVALWEVIEDPIAQIDPGLPQGSVDDYGFIGRGGVYGDPAGTAGPADPTRSYTRRVGGVPTAWPGQAMYQNQILKVTGTRVYGKAPSKPPTKFTGDTSLRALKKNRYNGLQWPQQRRVGCEILKWSNPKTKCS